MIVCYGKVYKLWKEYSSWTARSGQTRDRSISDTRAKLSAAGADASVIEAALADHKATYDRDMAKYQTSSTYKILKEGYDIARGAKKNPYSGKAKGVLYGDTLPESTGNKAHDLLRDWIPQKGKAGQALNTLDQFYGSGYKSGEVEVDEKAEAKKNAKLNAGGSGGSAVLTGYEKQKTAGSNPWVV